MQPQKEEWTGENIQSSGGFFLEDANSSPTAGKRETITHHKDKQQKRYLCDTMLNLYEKFKSENPSARISYTSFTRLRPFYVVPASVHQRDTVKCKLHCNVEFKASKLHALGVLKSANLTTLISSVVCSMEEETCMYGTCPNCTGNFSNIYNDATKTTSEESVTYFEWASQTDVRTTTKGVIKVNMMTKVTQTATLGNLCKIFEEEFLKRMPHQYRIIHQYKAIKMLKMKITRTECVLQVDFSENYACKAATEIQAMHFGGSR